MVWRKGLAGAVSGGPLAGISQAKVFHGETSQGRRVTATLNSAQKLTDLKMTAAAHCSAGHRRHFAVDFPRPRGVSHGSFEGQSAGLVAASSVLDLLRTSPSRARCP